MGMGTVWVWVRVGGLVPTGLPVLISTARRTPSSRSQNSAAVLLGGRYHACAPPMYRNAAKAGMRHTLPPPAAQEVRDHYRHDDRQMDSSFS
jgi:hypothetical protein